MNWVAFLFDTFGNSKKSARRPWGFFVFIYQKQRVARIARKIHRLLIVSPRKLVYNTGKHYYPLTSSRMDQQPYTLLIEGVIQIIIAIALFINVIRRGKNRVILALAWFFVSVGIFSLGPFLPKVFSVIPGLAAFVAYSSIVCHTSIFFGMAGYCGVQFGFLNGSKLMKTVLFSGLSIATLMVIFHTLSLKSSAVQALFVTISSWTMFGFFVVSLVFLAGIFFLLSRQLRHEKGALNYAATTGIGLILLLAALTIRKALDTMLPNLLVDALSFISLLLVIIGTWYQTSISMSPGIVFDSTTKKPLRNALVRVIRSGDGKLLESRRTKSDGRYGLLMEPGEYVLNVMAPGYAAYESEKIIIDKPTLIGRDVSLLLNSGR